MGTRETDLRDSIDGLYRMLDNPETILDFIAAVDERLTKEAPTSTLYGIAGQLRDAADELERRSSSISTTSVETALLSPSLTILRYDGSGLAFSSLLLNHAPGQKFVLENELSKMAFEAALRDLPSAGQIFLPVVANADGGRATLLIRRLSRDRAGARPSQEAEYVIAAMTPSPWSRAVEDALTNFRLTPAEIRVLKNLGTSEEVPALARRLGISEHTVRSQLRAIFGKLGISRQAELVRFKEDVGRLAATLDTFLGNDTSRQAMTGGSASSNSWPPRLHARTSTGRRVSYREYGDPDGVPIVVLHGAYSGSAIPDAFCPTAIECGVRLIAPDRPGYGASDPSTPGLDVASAAEETRELAEQLGLGRYAVLALAIATAFGMELARRNSRVTNLTICSPHFASANLPGAKPNLDLMIRNEIAKRIPWLTDQVMRVAWNSISHSQAEALARRIWRRSPVDQALVMEQGLASYFADVAMDARQSPVDGPLWELRALSTYRFHGADLAAPIHVCFGGDDKLTDVVRMRELFGGVANARTETFPNAGHLMFFPYWRDLLHRTKEAFELQA